MNKLSQFKESECSCRICRNMCHTPCWGTPEEIQKIIDSGFGNRLMKDSWDHEEEVYVLSPELKEHGCTFWKDGLCELHDLKLKPSEGKLAHCSKIFDKDDGGIRETIKDMWNTKKGRSIIKKWKK